MNWDISIFNLINQYAGRNEYIDSIAIFFAKCLPYILAFILLVFLVKNFNKYLPLILRAVGAGVLARFVFAEIIRFIWEKPRPFIENNINLILEHSSSASFPSGHTSFFFGLSTVIYAYNKKTGTLFFVASFLISISRVFSGIHWPADILAGAIIGIISGWLILKVFKKS